MPHARVMVPHIPTYLCAHLFLEASSHWRRGVGCLLHRDLLPRPGGIPYYLPSIVTRRRQDIERDGAQRSSTTVMLAGL